MPSDRIIVNTSNCTLDDVNQALSDVNNALNQIFTAIDTGGGGADVKVAVDFANVGSTDYLDNQLYWPLSGSADLIANPGAGVLIASDVTSAKERLQADFTTVNGIDALELGHRVFLELKPDVGDGYFLQWSVADDVTDNYTVLVTTDDSTPSYLHDAIHDNASYVDTSDIIVASATVGAASSDQTERFFVDVSAITGYHATEFRLLGLIGNVSTYFSLDDLSGYSIVAAGTYIDVAYSAGTWTVSVDLTEVSGYDGAAFQQTLLNNAGTFNWAFAGTRKGRVTTEISAATGPLTAQWGSGEVKLQDPLTGVLDSSATAVDNDCIGDSWVVNCQVTLDMNYNPPRVIGGSCNAVSWS